MALQLETTLPKNKSGNWWLITGVNLNIWNNITVVNYGLWKDQASALAKDDPVAIYQATVEGDANTAVTSQLGTEGVTPTNLAYTYLKNVVKYPIDFSTAELVP